MKFVAIADGRVQNARQESGGIDNQHIAVPAPDRMARASRLDVCGVLLHVHVNCPLQIELAILKDDAVLVLCDAIHRPIERPIENDAGRLTTEAWIVLAFELRCCFFSKVGELCAAVKPRARCGAGASARSTAGGAFTRLEIGELTE